MVNVMSEYKFLWESYASLATSARKQGNWGKAARILKEAFRDCEEFRELDPELIDMAYDLAELNLSYGRFAEAEALYRSVLEVREKLLGQTHRDVVESLKRVGIVQILAFRAEALGSKTVRSSMSWTEGLAATS